MDTFYHGLGGGARTIFADFPLAQLGRVGHLRNITDKPLPPPLVFGMHPVPRNLEELNSLSP